jgi:hypothetical protein
VTAAGEAATGTIAAVARKAGRPALAGGVAAASIAGAVFAGRALTPSRRRVLGVRVSSPRPGAWGQKLGEAVGSLPKRAPSPSQFDLQGLAGRLTDAGQQVGRVGRQLGRVAADVQRAGEATEQVGRHLSK